MAVGHCFGVLGAASPSTAHMQAHNKHTAASRSAPQPTTVIHGCHPSSTFSWVLLCQTVAPYATFLQLLPYSVTSLLNPKSAVEPSDAGKISSSCLLYFSPYSPFFSSSTRHFPVANAKRFVCSSLARSSSCTRVRARY